MQTNKINPIFKEHIKTSIKMGFGIILFLILFVVIFFKFFSKTYNARKYGEKIIATVTSIEENKGKTRSDNSIIRVFISYTYNSKEYSSTLPEYPKNVRVGDQFDIYILDGNPNDITLYTPYDSISVVFFVPFIIVFFIIIIYGIFKNIRELKLYNNSDSLDEINATFVSVYKKTYILPTIYHFFIVCESSELNMEFYSHYYSQDPSDCINKKDINKFKVKIDRTNPKKYIMDVNTVDRYMLK